MSETPGQYIARAIVDGEQESFLAHMCDAFSLDISSARPIFFNDPFYDLSHKRVLINTSTKEIVSSLTIVPTAIRVPGGALVSVAGLAGVCTTPEYRRKGHASRLIRETLRSVPAEFGYSVAALSTDQPDIYRSSGFARCSTLISWSAHRKLLPAFPEAAHAAAASLENPELLQEVKSLYDHSQGSQPGIFARSDKRWASIELGKPSNQAIIWRSSGRVEGCVIYRMKDHRGDRVLDVLDLIAATAAARRGLIGYIQSLDEVDLISGHSRPSDLRKLGIQDIPRFTSYQKDGVLMSIIDFDSCLSAVAGTGIMTPVIRRSESGLTIRLENSITPRDHKPLRLFSVSTDRLGVAIGIAPADEMTGDWISVDTGAMAQLFFGYRSAAKLRSQDRLWISNESALAIADSLFPHFDTALGALDSF